MMSKRISLGMWERDRWHSMHRLLYNKTLKVQKVMVPMRPSPFDIVWQYSFI